MNRIASLFILLLSTFVFANAFADEPITPSPAPKPTPRVLLVVTETNATKNPEAMIETTCTVDEFGILTLTKATGFNENEEAMKTEKLVEKKLDPSVLPQIKNALMGAVQGGYVSVAYSCDKGTTLFQGTSFQDGDLFDLFAARNCMDVVINTRAETHELLRMMRTWCGMKIMRPEGAISRR